MHDQSKIRDVLSKVTDDEILSLTPQNTAYSNYVYKIETQNNKYIYKEYISNIGILQKEVELNIQATLKFPEILYKDDKCRIEQFVEHEVPDWDADFARIAAALKVFHNTRIEIEMNQYDLLCNMLHLNADISSHHLIKKMSDRAHALVFDSDTVKLCHNDLQIGNMMSIDGQIKFIDFEYSSYGNIYIDIANLFCESMYDYEANCFLCNDNKIADRFIFLEAYFETNDVLAHVRKVYEAEFFSHYYWFLWSRHFAKNKNGPSKRFDYKKYAMARLNALVEHMYITEEEFSEIEGFSFDD